MAWFTGILTAFNKLADIFNRVADAYEKQVAANIEAARWEREVKINNLRALSDLVEKNGAPEDIKALVKGWATLGVKL